MAVSLFFGMTESGKTFLATKLLSNFNRAIIFDYTGKINPAGAFITSDFSEDGMLKLFKKFKDSKKFVIVFRPGRIPDAEIPFNKVAVFALILGRQAERRGETERLIFLVDEADFVCSSNYQSAQLKQVVNVGRHDLVDTWFIARIPQRLHTDARGNASKVFVFRLTDDSALGFIKKSYGGKGTAEKIKQLPKYSFLAWKDTGEIYIYDQNQNLVESWS